MKYRPSHIYALWTAIVIFILTWLLLLVYLAVQFTAEVLYWLVVSLSL